MGAPMVKRIAAAGHSLAVCGLDPARAWVVALEAGATAVDGRELLETTVQAS